MKRTITGETSAKYMTLGDLRQFLASIEGLPDEAALRARVRFRSKRLMALTVEEDDIGFRDYLKAVNGDESLDQPAS